MAFIVILISLLFALFGKDILIFLLFIIMTTVIWFIHLFISKLIIREYLKRFIHDIKDKNV